MVFTANSAPAPPVPNRTERPLVSELKSTPAKSSSEISTIQAPLASLIGRLAKLTAVSSSVLAVGPVVLAVDMRFHREAVNRERLVIKTRCLEYRGKVGRLEQVMERADGLPSCTAVFTFGLFDLRTRRLLRPTPEWLAAVGVAP